MLEIPVCRVSHVLTGQGSSPNSKLVGEFTKLMAEEGWKIASNSKLPPTMSATGGGMQPQNAGGKRNYSTGPGESTSKKYSKLNNREIADIFKKLWT